MSVLARWWKALREYARMFSRDERLGFALTYEQAARRHRKLANEAPDADEREYHELKAGIHDREAARWRRTLS